MSPISIKPVNILNSRTKYCTLSNFAQKYVKSQAKSTYFALERLFKGIEPELISKNEPKLKELGIKEIGKDMKEGVVISDIEYDYHVFSPESNYLQVDTLKTGSSEVYRHFSLNDKSSKYSLSGDYGNLNIEDEMSRALDFVEGKLLKAKSECFPAKIPQQFIQRQTTSDKIAKLNRAINSKKVNVDIKNIGMIGSKEKELLKSINDKLILIQELYKKISDGKTKWKVKKAYKNYMPQPVANKLGFKDIGPNGESICLFNTSYKNNAHIAITAIDNNGKELKFVISQDNGSVQKNLPSKHVKSEYSGYRIYFAPNYYTQKEVDESNLHSYLSCLDEEMEEYIKYTQNWFKQKDEIKLIKSNYDNATLDVYKDILDDIHTNFEKYREKMRKYLRKPKKSIKFKTENNISTKLASIAVKFDKITPEGYDLRLSYPKVHDKFATQLLVMQDDKIEKSFYIFNDKLLRFQIKDLNDKFFRDKQKLYYYDNKYLQESNLHDYLLLLQEKLHDLNEKLDIIINKQIKNRIKKTD